jgi:hypothetical protein
MKTIEHTYRGCTFRMIGYNINYMENVAWPRYKRYVDEVL